MTTSVIATMRGSWRRGFVSLAVSGAAASQPTNDSMSGAAAVPAAAQSCGTNGVQCSARAAKAPPTTLMATTARSSSTSSNWMVDDVRRPRDVIASIASTITAAIRQAVPHPVRACAGRALESAGIIAGYRAEPDPAKAGLGLTVFLGLKVNNHSAETAREVEETWWPSRRW